MNILVLNCGSSSLKYQLINMNDESVLAKGLCERIGIEGSRLKHEPHNSAELVKTSEMEDHTTAVKMVIEALLDNNHGVIKSVEEINAVGHRVVHGGEFFTDSVIITDEVKSVIDKCSELAPLHNPPNLIGINACATLMPTIPQVAVFDTAFHQTMPDKAYLYAIPYELYSKYKIRRYGFHGTSHKYVSMKAAEALSSTTGKPVSELKIVTCHLGNGASVCAVDGGKSVDTSMGFTPLEGLAMGTRCGDIDPAVISFISAKEKLSLAELDNLLNKKSGVFGVSGVSSDFRDVEAAVKEGNDRARVSLDIFNYRVAKYIGEYAAAMNGIDAVVFTAGIGENAPSTREAICQYLGYLGLTVDSNKNNCRGKEVDFATPESKVRAYVIPTNEELVIARDTKSIVERN